MKRHSNECLLFVAFFIFVGNMKNLEIVRNMLNNITSKREIMVSVILSQAISNVPAAILLSNFTDNITKLIIGTNLGGLGTLIASMASLEQKRSLPNSCSSSRTTARNSNRMNINANYSKWN